MLAVVLVTTASASIVLTALIHIAAHVRMQRAASPSKGHPAISILKPLKGVDEGLDENLRSIAAQDYPGEFEIILAAADPSDPALDAAQRLRKSFPDVRVRVVPGALGPALNPKVANLIPMTRAAEHDFLLVSDSNVRVEPDYLRSIVAGLDDAEVGIVTNPVIGTGEKGLGATFENLHLGGFIAPVMCAAATVGHPVVVGKSMLVRRSVLAELGGWEAVGDVLGEDYLMGRLTVAAGYRVMVSPLAVKTVAGAWTVTDFLSRHLRWAQMRRHIAPMTFAVEPMIHPTPLLLASAMFADLAWTAAAAIIAVKAVAEVTLVGRLRGKPLPRWAVLAVPFKDILIAGLWPVAWVKRTVTWRGNRARIGPDSRLTPLAPAALAPEVHGPRP